MGLAAFQLFQRVGPLARIVHVFGQGLTGPRLSAFSGIVVRGVLYKIDCQLSPDEQLVEKRITRFLERGVFFGSRVHGQCNFCWTDVAKMDIGGETARAIDGGLTALLVILRKKVLDEVGQSLARRVSRRQILRRDRPFDRNSSNRR